MVSTNEVYNQKDNPYMSHDEKTVFSECHFVKPKEVQKTLGIQTSTLRSWTDQGKIPLLELHMDNVSTIDKIFSHCLISLYLLHRFRNKNIVTVESLPPNKWMILKDKSLFSDKNSMITSWFQMSLRVLIGKEKVFRPFWNNHCQEISQRLWSPIGTDYVDLRLNSWNSSSVSMIPDSSFLIKKQERVYKISYLRFPRYDILYYGSYDSERFCMYFGYFLRISIFSLSI